MSKLKEVNPMIWIAGALLTILLFVGGYTIASSSKASQLELQLKDHPTTQEVRELIRDDPKLVALGTTLDIVKDNQGVVLRDLGEIKSSLGEIKGVLKIEKKLVNR